MKYYVAGFKISNKKRDGIPLKSGETYHFPTPFESVYITIVNSSEKVVFFDGIDLYPMKKRKKKVKK